MNIYFIRVPCCGFIKIGRATNVRARLADPQCANPHKLELVGSFEAPGSLERRLHREFEDERIQGEWFNPSDRLLRKIKELLENPPPPSSPKYWKAGYVTAVGSGLREEFYLRVVDKYKLSSRRFGRHAAVRRDDLVKALETEAAANPDRTVYWNTEAFRKRLLKGTAGTHYASQAWTAP